MSRVRVHNFSVSLDGFGTGEGQTLEMPFGHAGHRLHDWFFPTRTFQEMQGKSGGGSGVDEAMARTWAEGIGAEIMGRNKFGPQRGRGRTTSGPAGGAPTRRSTRRCSC